MFAAVVRAAGLIALLKGASSLGGMMGMGGAGGGIKNALIKFARPGGATTFGERAPKGGTTIGGEFFKGGQFLPHTAAAGGGGGGGMISKIGGLLARLPGWFKIIGLVLLSSEKVLKAIGVIFKALWKVIEPAVAFVGKILKKVFDVLVDGVLWALEGLVRVFSDDTADEIKAIREGTESIDEKTPDQSVAAMPTLTMADLLAQRLSIGTVGADPGADRMDDFLDLMREIAENTQSTATGVNGGGATGITIPKSGPKGGR